MALEDDLTTLETNANAVVMAVEQVKTDVANEVTTTPTEDPVWVSVQAALVAGGWTAPVVEAPETPGETPDAEDTAEVAPAA